MFKLCLTLSLFFFFIILSAQRSGVGEVVLSQSEPDHGVAAENNEISEGKILRRR